MAPAPSFKAFVTVLFLSLALCQITAAEPSLKEDKAEIILRSIEYVNTKSSKVRENMEKVTEDNVFFQGVVIPEGLSVIADLVAKMTHGIFSGTNAHASDPLSDDDAKLVVETLESFVEVQQQVLKVVIRKHELQKLTLFIPDIQSSLQRLEVYVRVFSSKLIDLLPTRQEAAKTQFDSFTVTINEAIRIYYGGILSPRDSLVKRIQVPFQDLTELPHAGIVL